MMDGIGFTQARNLLIYSRPVPIKRFTGLLLPRIQKEIQSIRILDGLFHELYSEMMGAGIDLMDENRNLFEKTLEAINGIAPIDEMLVDGLEEPEGINFLYPANFGYPMSWDEWGEISETLDISESLQLMVFIMCLNMGERDTFTAASEKFHWRVRWPAGLTPDDFDCGLFFRLLEERGYAEFVDGCNVCFYDTGNPYFDFNPYDSDDWSEYGIEFTVKGVLALKDAYEEALPIQKNLGASIERFCNEKGTPAALLKAWVEAHVQRVRVRI